ncbi:hypothetical protein LR48_Vigan10g063300 [Vigna angularis]|uniref:Uncharacterized protein n=1 Tax=Phaseolus angularis TaxID=3914 RepID=A0A0L9VI59_PHAAN|nr:hypothetical protein LR48_Vigan10g063300 [Vigna angularis]
MTSSGSGPTGGSGRSVTRMPDITSNWVSEKLVTVEFDPRSFAPIREHATSFRSYLGVLAKAHVLIVANCWDDVLKVDKNILWQDILENGDIPNDERIRKKILSHIVVRWREFKTRMTRVYVFVSK